MRLWMKTPVTAVLLALVVALTSLPGVGLADDDNDKKKKKDKQEASQQSITPADARPDLKIEYTGFPPNAEYTVTFKVTNVGIARSTAIKAQIQTLSGGPPNLTTPDVPALAPGQSHVLFYGFGNCSGSSTVILATVNDPLDLPSVNDRAEGEVCADLALPPIVPESPPVLVLVIEDLLTPAHLRVGEHKDGGRFPAVEIAPTIFRVHGLRRTSEGPVNPTSECDGSPGLSYLPHVGFDFEIGTFCDENFVFQLILDFDLQWLRDIERKLIFGVELLYDEGPRNVSGGSPTCVSRVGQAPANWPEIVTRTSSRNSLTPTLLTTQDIAGDRVAGGWDVTEEIRSAARPDLAGQWHGLVLHGLDENLGSEDQKICMSHVNNARLKLQYVVL